MIQCSVSKYIISPSLLQIKNSLRRKSCIFLTKFALAILLAWVIRQILFTLNLLSWKRKTSGGVVLISKHACRYIENDMPPLSYSADISDVFLVSFVSMMEHGRQFHDRRTPWRSSNGCPIEFPFSGQRALQRMPSFTYLAVILPSHLPATTDIAPSFAALATDRFFLPFGSSRWYSYSNHEIFNDSPFRSPVFYSLRRFLISIRLVQSRVYWSHCFATNYIDHHQNSLVRTMFFQHYMKQSSQMVFC